MTNQEAADILLQHNRWRRGAEIPMSDPQKLSQAIDLAVKALNKAEKKVGELARRCNVEASA